MFGVEAEVDIRQQQLSAKSCRSPPPQICPCSGGSALKAASTVRSPRLAVGIAHFLGQSLEGQRETILAIGDH